MLERRNTRSGGRPGRAPPVEPACGKVCGRNLEFLCGKPLVMHKKLEALGRIQLPATGPSVTLAAHAKASGVARDAARRRASARWPASKRTAPGDRRDLRGSHGLALPERLPLGGSPAGRRWLGRPRAALAFRRRSRFPPCAGAATRSGDGSAAGSLGVSKAMVSSEASALEPRPIGCRARGQPGRSAEGGRGKLRLAAPHGRAVGVRVAWWPNPPSGARSRSRDRRPRPEDPWSGVALSCWIREARTREMKSPAAFVCTSRYRLTRRRGVTSSQARCREASSLHPTPPLLARPIRAPQRHFVVAAPNLPDIEFGPRDARTLRLCRPSVAAA